eukprot:TRINITY_DN3439_c0_g3_i1.p1 TRINITY_DN3439_c0_g3~~TRINITY_DN3439_c0_g3_i1.p1  ORF type:complete len:503 (+),score=110.23 TRINITY_DN3439_c0_g3_i1:102-1511(+)
MNGENSIPPSGLVAPPPFMQQQHQGEDGQRAMTENPPSRTLWLGGITTVHSEEALWKYFEKFGELDCIKVLYAKNIAFVNFMTMQAAVLAKAGVDKDLIGGVRLQHNFAKGSPPPLQPTGKCSLGEHEYPSNIVWIGGLHIPPLTERFLVELFSGFPGLVNVVVYSDKKIAFINFQTIQHATVARNSLIGKPLAGVPVKVCYGKPPAATPQAKAMGFQDNPTTYILKNLAPPVDYYAEVNYPDALTEQEVEDFIDQIREYSPSDPDAIHKSVKWILAREHKIKDVMKLLELRLQDMYLHQPGKRLQALYMLFALLKKAKSEDSAIISVLSRGGYITKIMKVMCWNQAAAAIGFISQVLSGAFEIRTINEGEFLALSSLIKGDAEVQMLKMTYGIAGPGAPPGMMPWGSAPLPLGPPPPAASRGAVAVRGDSDSESSDSRQRRRRRRREDDYGNAPPARGGDRGRDFYRR